jgi:di/tricarboxylate transporter
MTTTPWMTLAIVIGGYPTNTMVYHAGGGYRFTDFMKVGIPLIAVLCAPSMILIPYFWPLQP